MRWNDDAVLLSGGCFLIMLLVAFFGDDVPPRIPPAMLEQSRLEPTSETYDPWFTEKDYANKKVNKEDEQTKKNEKKTNPPK